MPDVLEVWRVNPIDKGGDAADPSNYRLIPTFYSFAQIFEKQVYLKVILLILKNVIYPE